MGGQKRWGWHVSIRPWDQGGGWGLTDKAMGCGLHLGKDFKLWCELLLLELLPSMDFLMPNKV